MIGIEVASGNFYDKKRDVYVWEQEGVIRDPKEKFDSMCRIAE